MTTDTTKIERAKELDRNASKDWRAAHTRPDEEVWMPHPEGLAGHCDQRLLLRLNPNYKSEADVAFIAESRALLPEITSIAERLISALDALAKGATSGPCSGDCAAAKPCSACAARAVVAWWHDRGDAAIEERDAARNDLENLKKEVKDLTMERAALISAAADELAVSHTMALINRRAECYAIIERLDRELGQYKVKVDELHEGVFQAKKSREEAIVLAAQLRSQLAQAERDKAAMRGRIEGLTRYDAHTAYSMISKSDGGFLHRGDVLRLFAAHRATRPETEGA